MHRRTCPAMSLAMSLAASVAWQTDLAGARDPVLSAGLFAEAGSPVADDAGDGHRHSQDRAAYVAGIVGASFLAGAAASTGDGALGVSVPRPLGAVRLEVEARRRAPLSGGRPGPAPASDGAWTTMANVWRDVSVADHLSLYAGGGAGIGSQTQDADGGGPEPASRGTAFGWQAGGGATYAITDRVTIDVGGRLSALEGAGPAASEPAAEVLVAVRVADPFRRWLGR